MQCANSSSSSNSSGGGILERKPSYFTAHPGGSVTLSSLGSLGSLNLSNIGGLSISNIPGAVSTNIHHAPTSPSTTMYYDQIKYNMWRLSLLGRRKLSSTLRLIISDTRAIVDHRSDPRVTMREKEAGRNAICSRGREQTMYVKCKI